MHEAHGGEAVVVDRATLHELGDFVARRIDDELRRADESGDRAALSRARASRDLLTTMRRDLDERPWAHREIGNYLLRAARIRSDHPEFRFWWH